MTFDYKTANNFIKNIVRQFSDDLKNNRSYLVTYLIFIFLLYAFISAAMMYEPYIYFKTLLISGHINILEFNSFEHYADTRIYRPFIYFSMQHGRLLFSLAQHDAILTACRYAGLVYIFFKIITSNIFPTKHFIKRDLIENLIAVLLLNLPALFYIYMLPVNHIKVLFWNNFCYELLFMLILCCFFRLTVAVLSFHKKIIIAAGQPSRFSYNPNNSMSKLDSILIKVETFVEKSEKRIWHYLQSNRNYLMFYLVFCIVLFMFFSFAIETDDYSDWVMSPLSFNLDISKLMAQDNHGHSQMYYPFIYFSFDYFGPVFALADSEALLTGAWCALIVYAVYKIIATNIFPAKHFIKRDLIEGLIAVLLLNLPALFYIYTLQINSLKVIIWHIVLYEFLFMLLLIFVRWILVGLKSLFNKILFLSRERTAHDRYETNKKTCIR